MQVIAIDVGRSGVKVVSGGSETYFPSKVGEARDMDMGEKGDYVITVNGDENQDARRKQNTIFYWYSHSSK